MKMNSFWMSETGAVTVDWTVLASGAVGLALATAAMLTDTLDMVFSRADHELRQQQFSDDFVRYTPAHFEHLFAHGVVDAETAASQFAAANAMMNHEIVDALEWGVTQMQAGTLSATDLAMLYAMASVAYQRNIVPDHLLRQYFPFIPA